MARSCHDAFDDATPARGIYELAAGASGAAGTHGAGGRHGASRAVGTTGGNSSAVVARSRFPTSQPESTTRTLVTLLI